jgi:hypothetical protein
MEKMGQTPIIQLFKNDGNWCLSLFFPFFLILAGACFAQPQTETSMWQVAKSEHFIIYYEDAPAGYVNGLIRDAEKYYFSILDKLGFTRFDRFWSWEDRCKIYIYSEKEDYNKKTGQPPWSQASVNVKQRIISTFLGQNYFKETLLPHEMAHLIFREYIGFNVSLPLWLDEGAACLQEPGSRVRVDSVRGFFKSDLFIPLDKLTGMGVDDIKSPAVFYAEATSAVDFLLAKYGKEKFVDFCRKIRDNTYWLDGLTKVYGFKGLSQANAEWVDWLGRKR